MESSCCALKPASGLGKSVECLMCVGRWRWCLPQGNNCTKYAIQVQMGCLIGMMVIFYALDEPRVCHETGGVEGAN